MESAFDKIKNGPETVAKTDLEQMFQSLELESKYIEVVVQELSLCSTDLEHLNFMGFFERFYVENMADLQNGQLNAENGQIDEEDQFESSH